MIDLHFRPLAAPPYKSRRCSTFRSTWVKTLDLLEDELTRIGAKDIIVQAGFGLADIRNDGWPKAGIRASHPAVVLSFRDRKGTPLSFPCDTYTDYQDNLRAIGLSLEALRSVNRYGVTKGHEQYQGFAALPPADPNMKREQAIQFIARETGRTVGEVEQDTDRAYRQAAAKLHPDAQTGSHEKFVQLQQHAEAL